MPANIQVVYFSANNHTHLMAEAFAEGVRNAGGTPDLYRVQGSDIVEGRWKDPGGIVDKLRAADAIVLGSPTYMGTVAAQVKAVIDALGGEWFKLSFKDKVAGGFTHSSSPSGDKVSTLEYMSLHAAQHMMIWVGNGTMPARYTGEDHEKNHLGGFKGVMAQQNPEEGEDADASITEGVRGDCVAYGERIAKACG